MGTRAAPPGSRGGLSRMWGRRGVRLDAGGEGMEQKGRRGFSQCHPVIQHTSSLPLFVTPALPSLSLTLLYSRLSYPLPLNIPPRRQANAFFFFPPLRSDTVTFMNVPETAVVWDLRATV